MARPPSTTGAGVAALGLVLWLLVWAVGIRGPGEAFAVFAAAGLVALGANLAAPFSQAGRWAPAHVGGAGAFLLGGLLVALAEAARIRGVDPPEMDREQLPPLLWVLGSVAFLVGGFLLLGPPARAARGPACARCDAPAAGRECVRCGLPFFGAGDAPTRPLGRP